MKDRRFWLLAGCGVFLSVFLVFSENLQGEFLSWDDFAFINQNIAIQGLDWSHLKQIFSTCQYGFYVPLSQLSLAFDYALWEFQPPGYHLTSILLHCCNAALTFLLARRLLSAANPGRSENSLLAGAAFSALFFAIHPLRAESVSWISERRDVLCGFFTLFSALAYCRHTQESLREKESRLWLPASFAFFILSILSKAASVGLPIVFFLLDIYPFRRLERPFNQKKLPILLEKIPFLLVSLAIGLTTIFSVKEEYLYIYSFDVNASGWLERAAQAAASILFYLHHLLFPLKLVPFYNYDPQTVADQWLIWGGIASFLAITFFSFRHRRQAPALWIAWLAWLVLLAPFLGFFGCGSQFAADRYTYLASIPPAIAFAAIFRVRRFSAWRLPAVLFLGLLGFLCWRQAAIWNTSLSFWNYCLRMDPENFNAWTCLGRIREKMNDGQGSADAYHEAVRLKPHLPELWCDWGESLDKLGRSAATAHAFKKALEIDCHCARAHNGLGKLHARAGRHPVALQYFKTALKLSPSPQILLNIGICHDSMGQSVEAAEAFSSAARQNLPEAWLAWSNLLLKQERFSDALSALRQGAERTQDSRLLAAFIQGVICNPAPASRDIKLASSFMDALKKKTGSQSVVANDLAGRFASRFPPQKP
ncbi:MAG: tetratricopeptide repeat protein [Verrucomicrobiae bacterium]|nr:tetratricopeptide repeat protein [Verrucomicrobiae bacterium]